jgi:hypothetical protein
MTSVLNGFTTVGGTELIDTQGCAAAAVHRPIKNVPTEMFSSAGLSL